MAHYEIQIRKHGTWQRWIGFKDGAALHVATKAWETHCAVSKHAARLAEVGDKTRVLQFKHAS